MHQLGFFRAVFVTRLASALLAIAIPLAATAADSSCATNCIDVHGMDIHEISLNSTRTYPVAAAKTKDEVEACLDRYEDEQLCRRGGQLDCEEYGGFPQMRYITHRYGDVPDRNLTKINARIAMLAKANSCNPSSFEIAFSAERIYARGTLLSLVFFDLDLSHGDNGGCHGQYLTMTFDTLHSAEPLPLSAAVRVEDYAALRQVLLQELQAQNPDVFSGSTQHQQIGQRTRVLLDADDYLRNKAPHNGFYLEDGQVHINLGDFLFSCADGDFNGLVVPDRFLKPAFRALLQDAHTQ